MNLAVKSIRTFVIFAISFAAGLWVLRQQKPPAPALSVEQVQLVPATAEEILKGIPALGAKVVVVNHWATWCGPCVEEFPHFVKLYKELKADGMALIFVSADFSSNEQEAKNFLASQGVDFKTYIKKQDDQAFIDGFSKDWSGALPTTFIYDSHGVLKHYLPKPLSYAELHEKVTSLLKNPQSPNNKESL